MLIKDLDPGDVRRVSALLDEALDLPAEARAAWHAELARREPRLSEVVTELLSSMSLESGDTRSAVSALPIALGTSAQEGRMYGPWRVLTLLGQGGMGTVWLAERADGLFERKVALKLLHNGLFGAALRERFARERRILGALEHPRIARLLDAGVADDGQPYLALEYVEGTSLTAHCDQQRLSVTARVALMTQVLSAVQHAHENLVLHRDLKPANILVTRAGEVRLLDFGIAKLMTDGLVQETELTHSGGRALTPEFASPEQIAGRPLSTASDVYSLGVLLYALLCGQRPYRLSRDSRAALEDAIMSAQPVRPSQQELTAAISDARATTPAKLRRQLAGDLDTIVLKAIKKDPAERYATADELLRELQRYLHGEPVHARPDSVSYRCRKFVARNRLPVGVGLLILLAAGVSLWQGERAREHAAIAQREAQRARTVEAFVINIFKANSDDQADPLRARQTTARELLDVGARQAADSLKDSPEAQHEILQTLANMYTQLGLNDEAARLREQRVASMRRSYGNADVRIADALLAFVDDIALTNERARAIGALAEAERILDEVGERSSERRAHLWVTSADLAQYFSLAQMRRDADRGLAAASAQQQNWSLQVVARQVSARGHYLTGRYALAEADNRAALAEVDQRDPDSTWAVTPLIQLAETLYARLQLEEAEQTFRRALSLSRRINGDEYCLTLQTRAKLGYFLHATGRRDEGSRLLEETRAIIERQGKNATPDSTSVMRVSRGSALLEEGRVAEAEASYAAELAYRRRYFPASIPLAQALLFHASAQTALAHYEAAAAELEEAWSLWQRTGADAAEPAASNVYVLERARWALARGDDSGAEQRLTALATPHEDLPLRLDESAAQLMLAEVRLRQQRWHDAEQLARPVLAQVRASALRERFANLEAQAGLRLGQALRGMGNDRAACDELAHALQLRAAGAPWLADVERAAAACDRAELSSRAELDAPSLKPVRSEVAR